MWSIVEYLKRPELVVATQEWFGVEYINADGDNDVICDENQSLESDCQINRTTHEQSKGTHKRNISSQSTESNGSEYGNNKYTENADTRYRITNKFWYYLFIIGTELGDELFYATMIPFWFWNIDGAVGRRVVFVWSVVMYVGQGLKDIIRWPRPGPPVQRLQSKWSVEYGMPSTHAMVYKMKIFKF